MAVTPVVLLLSLLIHWLFIPCFCPSHFRSLSSPPFTDRLHVRELWCSKMRDVLVKEDPKGNMKCQRVCLREICPTWVRPDTSSVGE